MKLSFDYGIDKIEFNVVYSKRKTVCIKIEPPGTITVIAPEKTKDEVIIGIVKNKGGWISKKLSEAQDKQLLKKVHEYLSGEDFLYLGLNYALQITIDKAAKNPIIFIEEDLLYATVDKISIDKIKASLEMWYRERATDKILERIEYYQMNFKEIPSKVIIKNQKKRWGSCNSRRELFFNWRIIMAPIKVFDYIVVHEMSHMVYLNHSKEFWGLVYSIIPDYKVQGEWLKKNGITLNI